MKREEEIEQRYETLSLKEAEIREEHNRVESESNVLMELGIRVQEQSVRVAKEHEALSTQKQEIARAKIEIATEQQKIEQKRLKIQESLEEIRIGRQLHQDIRLDLAKRRKEIAEESARLGESSSQWLSLSSSVLMKEEEEKQNVSSIVRMALQACQFGGDLPLSSSSSNNIKTPQPPRVLEVSDIYTSQDFN